MNQTILLFYKYVNLADPASIVSWQKELGARLGLTGRIIVAGEGINGTVGGPDEAITQYLQEFLGHADFLDTDIKRSSCTGQPFGNGKFRVLLKREIVRLGIDPQDLPFTLAAPAVSPDQAHEMMSSRRGHKDFVILDTRNRYESRVGTFDNAITPEIETFSELPEYIQNNQELFKDKDVLMFCTGGVRCERASAYLKETGIAREVTHIRGGIDRYVHAYPEGHFKGHNYVFDGRVTVPVSLHMLTACDICGSAGTLTTNCTYMRCNKRMVVCNTCHTDYRTMVCSQSCAGLIQQFPDRQRTTVSVTASVYDRAACVIE